jgi:hypothetical protein
MFLLCPVKGHAAEKEQKEAATAELETEKLSTEAQESKERKTGEWIAEIGKIYLQDKMSPKDQDRLLEILELKLGIGQNGHLDIIKTWSAQSALERSANEHNTSGTNENFIYMEDKVNLLGYNYIYFETCTVYKSVHAERFIKYFENGFYPNRSLFIKEANYYKILYYYLYLVQDSLIGKINRTITQLNETPTKAPDFSKEDIKTFCLIVNASTELDNIRLESEVTGDSLFKKTFSLDEQKWINAAVDYFASPETHTALYSYEWFNSNIPLSLTAQVISHDIQLTWKKQAIAYRASLPLMLFADDSSTQTSVKKLFDSTLSKLELDNREVDIMVLSALKTWLSKQIRHGISVDDRIMYSKILSELEVCPSGRIFYNLYTSIGKIEKLKEYTRMWDSLNSDKKNTLFENKIDELYFEATDNLSSVFNDLEKIFGKEKIYGRQIKLNSVNHIFHKYRGESNYYYEYLKLGLFDKETNNTQVPLSNLKNNCLYDFKAAFVKADEKKINHVNLLKAYNLLLRELVRRREINEIRKYEKEIDSFVSGKHKLGSILAHYDNNLYDIYRLIAYAYISSDKRVQHHALDVARKSFFLAKSYYIEVSREHGYILEGKIGAMDTNYTQTDDYERQFEFYQDIAQKLGKKIQLLLPPEDVGLYNRMRSLRNPKGLLL